MDIQKKLEDIFYKLREINTDESRVISECLKEKENDLTIEYLFDLFDFTLDSYRQSRTAQIISMNEQVRNAISWFVQNGIWVNISQIRRELLNDLENAIKNERLLPKNDSMIKQLLESIEIEKTWQNLTLKNKAKLLNSIQGDV